MFIGLMIIRLGAINEFIRHILILAIVFPHDIGLSFCVRINEGKGRQGKSFSKYGS
jgi:hypothetical protein